MITILSRIFIPKSMPEDKRRSAYGMLCGIVGVFLNLLLFCGKFLVGMISGSIAITADAFNNLSDAGSSVVTLVGFKLAESKPDSEHPFGHGRIEYVAGFIVSVVILIVAVELIRDSAAKILHPADTVFSLTALLVLAVSVLVKCYMAYVYGKIGKKYDSAALLAVKTDSLSDSVTTCVVIAAAAVEKYTGLHVDGYCGVVVGVIIFYAGISAARDTINPIIGLPPEKEFVEKIGDIILGFDDNIRGFHDLIVHDYGPGRRFISIHAEVPADGSLLELHEVADRLEKKLSSELGCMAVIHLDPVVTGDDRVGELRKYIDQITKRIDPDITVHDFRVAEEGGRIMLIFDVVVPYRLHISDVQIKEQVQHEVTELLGEKYAIMIQIDQAEIL